MAGQYTYDQVADRIVTELGLPRPALSTLRAAAATAVRGTNQRVRVTAGMPRPLQGRVNRQVVFDAAAIDTWLADHPASGHSSATAPVGPCSRPPLLPPSQHQPEPHRQASGEQHRRAEGQPGVPVGAAGKQQRHQRNAPVAPRTTARKLGSAQTAFNLVAAVLGSA